MDRKLKVQAPLSAVRSALKSQSCPWRRQVLTMMASCGVEHLVLSVCQPDPARGLVKRLDSEQLSMPLDK